MTLLTTSRNLFPLWERMFEDENQDLNYGRRNTLPAVNILEDEDGYAIEVAAPGLKKEDFKINYENNLLTISSQVEEKESKDEFKHREFYYSNFKRNFTVPEKVVDSEKINASYVDGILRISLPKREELKPKPAKEIEIA